MSSAGPDPIAICLTFLVALVFPVFVRPVFVRSSEFIHHANTRYPTSIVAPCDHSAHSSVRLHCATPHTHPRWEHLIHDFTRTQEARSSTKSGCRTTVNLSPSSHQIIVSLATQRQRRRICQALFSPPPCPTPPHRIRPRRSSLHSPRRSPTPFNVPATTPSDCTA